MSSSDALAAFDFRQLEPVGPAARNATDALAAARVEAELLHEEARREGYEQGRREAWDAVRAEAEPAVAALSAAVEEVRAAQAEVAGRLEAQAVELGLRIAEKALAGALAARPELVVDVLAGALRGLVERERVTVLVNPDDLDLVREATEPLVSTLGGIGHLDVQAERRVGRGGVVLRTEEGEIDATLETKLERAREVIEQELRR